MGQTLSRRVRSVFRPLGADLGTFEVARFPQSMDILDFPGARALQGLEGSDATAIADNIADNSSTISMWMGEPSMATN